MKPKEILSHDIVITTYGVISNEWVGFCLFGQLVFFVDVIWQSTTKTRIAQEKIMVRFSIVVSIGLS